MKKLKYLDNIDLTIIKALLDLESEEVISTYNLTKVLYTDLKDEYNLRKKDSFIIYRIKRLKELGIIGTIPTKEATCYGLKKDKIIIKNIFIKNKKQKSLFVHYNKGWHSFPLKSFLKNPF